MTILKILEIKKVVKKKIMFPDLGSQYKFVKEIGRGGSGVVYLALDRHSGFLVCVKKLLDEHSNNDEFLIKFKSEANIYLMLNHPNIVSLKDFIVKNNSFYLVQEYVEGQNLQEYIQNVTGPIPSKVTIEMLKYIIKAIDYAHNKNIALSGYHGVLHLDIKPANILISKSGDIKIIDFGISQGNNQKRGNQVMGTPLFMAPEQLDIRRQLDKRTDIYALGTLIHVMITGNRPFKNCNTRDEVLDNILNQKLTRTNELYPGVDKRFQNIIDKATEKNPNYRYQSCKELLTAIEQL